MTTFYIDPVLGDNNNDCLSFATAGKTLSALNLGVAAGGDEIRVVESPAVAINGSVKFTQQLAGTLSLTATAMTSTSPIQVTSATHGLVTGDYVYISSTAGQLGANGFWKITKVDDNNFTLNNSITNGTWTSGGTIRKRTGTVLEFENQQVRNVSLCGNQFQTAYPYNSQNWTPSTNVNCVQNTASSYIAGNCQQFGVTASFTTGKIAYQNIGSSLNLSAYTHLNFLCSFATSTAVPADGVYYLALCSDTAGNTVVDTFPLNNVVVSATAGINMKYCVQKQGGGNLGSSIQSIAIYRSSAASGTANIVLENITAGLAPSTSNVNIKSLISNATTFAGWYQLAGITQDYAILNNPGNYLSGTSPSYYPLGPSILQSANKMEGFDVGNLSGGATYQAINYSTPLVDYITVQGGWTRASSMTVNNGGISMWTCGSLLGTGLSMNNRGNTIFDSLGFANFSTGLITSSNAYNLYIGNSHFVSNALGASLTFSSNVNIGTDTCYGTQNTSHISMNGILGSAQNCVLYCCGANGSAITVAGSSNYINNIYSAYGAGPVITSTSSNSNFESITSFQHYASTSLILNASSGFSKFNNLLFYSTPAFALNGINLTNSNGNIFTNCLIDSFSTGVNLTGCSYNTFINTQINNATSPIFISNVANTNFIKCSGFNMPYGASIGSSIQSYIEMTNCRDLSNNLIEGTFYVNNLYSKKSNAISRSGTYSWAVNIGAFAGTAGWRNEYCPLKNSLSKIKCVAGKTYTVSCWVLRTESANQNAYLLCMGGQINGVVNDVVSPNASAGDNVWEQLTMPSFTPTQSGVVEIVGANYGSSTSLIHWDDISIVEA
jgi:hypothetical protein